MRATKLAIEQRKYEGLLVVPGVFLGSRLSAMNEDWIRSVQYPAATGASVIQDSTVVSIEAQLSDPANAPHVVPGAHFRPLSHVLNVSDSVPNYFAPQQTVDGESAAEDASIAIPSSSLDLMDVDTPHDRTPGGSPLPLRPLVYFRVAVADSHDENISQHFDSAVAFMTGAISSGGSVLVHCREGRSRSVTVVIAYLMMEKKWMLAQAYETMEAIAPDININEGFKRQLMELEMTLHQRESRNFFDKGDRVEKVDYSEIKPVKPRKKKSAQLETTKEALVVPEATAAKATLILNESVPTRQQKTEQDVGDLFLQADRESVAGISVVPPPAELQTSAIATEKETILPVAAEEAPLAKQPIQLAAEKQKSSQPRKTKAKIAAIAGQGSILSFFKKT